VPLPLRALLLLLAVAAGGCGDEAPAPVEPGHWRHCVLEGLARAGGLTVYGDDLLAVAGGGDRGVYTVSTRDVAPGATLHARRLPVDVREEAALLGAEPFALQGYTMKHLWPLPVDFQGVAVQAPDVLYVGERSRRVIFWGRLVKDASGRLDRVRFTEVSIAPGADRTGVAAGDWSDHGPGLAGLLALQGRPRMEDLYVLDAAPHGGPALRIYRMDRYGSALGTIPIQHDLGEGVSCNALSWDGSRYVLHYGAGRGRVATVKEPDAMRSGTMTAGAPGPDVEGVDRWTGMTHGADGTIYLVSNGDPAVLAWRSRQP